MKSTSFFMRIWLIVVTLSLSIIPIHGSRFVKGNGTYPQTFSVAPTDMLMDRANGTVYWSLNASGDTYEISKGYRRYSHAPLNAVPIGALLSSATVPLLALATKQGIPARTIAGALITTGGTILNTVFALATDGSVLQTSEALNDASGAINVDGDSSNGIIALAANDEFIFSAVRPNGDVWGALDSGIAVARINYNNILYPFNLSSVIQTAATAGDAGIKAKKLDATNTEVFSPASSGTITEPPVYITSSPPPKIISRPLYWDDPLQRLYMGLICTSTGAANDIARSIVVGRIDDMGILTYSAITPDSAISAAAPANQQEIVAGQTTGGAFSLTAFNVNVMHTSTGPSYLIVNGGNGLANEAGPYIFALPLVDLSDGDGYVDPTDDPVHGTLADINSALVDGKFVVQATASGELAKDPTKAAGGDTFCLVGGAQLPFYALPSTTTYAPSDMVVIDDTVYISINVTQSSTNDTGIFYSQAKFDDTGKIIGWTPWAQRAFPLDALPGPMNPGIVNFFEVDAVTGTVWAVGDDQGFTAAISDWDRGRKAKSLVTVLNTMLSEGCYSVLDLDAFTRGFDGNTGYRYALFGGVNRVVMALISQNFPGDTAAQAPQIVLEDYTVVENIRDTRLPGHAGDVTALEYSRNETADSNYFFAGTQNGLFVFTDGPSGFSSSTLNTLDLAPFSTGNWSAISTINGAIIDIKTLGNSLYVLTFTTSPSQPMQSTLYRIPFTSSITTMFATGNIFTIAQSNVGIFSGISFFSGIQLIATADDSTTEQLVLATNHGLFESTTVGGVQTATTQTLAAWDLISSADQAMYYGVAGTNPSVVINPNFTTGGPKTVWPISVRDAHKLKIYDRGSIQQLSGDDIPLDFSPTQFNGNKTGSNFTTLPPITNFFSDGARRVFIIKKPEYPSSVNALMISPYNAIEWAVSNPAQNVVFSAALPTELAYFWVKNIGMSGILMAGVKNGVVGLE